MKSSVFILWEGYGYESEIKGIYNSRTNGVKAMEELYIRRAYHDNRDTHSIRLEEHLLNTDPDFEESYVNILVVDDLLDEKPELIEACRERWKNANDVYIWKREYKQQFYKKINFVEGKR